LLTKLLHRLSRPPRSQGKGRRRKVGRDARGLPVYKWAKERKK